MNLIIDLGNTRVKLAVFENNTLLFKEVFQKNTLMVEVEKIFSKYTKLSAAIVSSVHFFTTEEADFIKERVPLLVLNHDLKFPFTNLYATPKTLGADRLALMAAAALHYPKQAVLVIDAGTCVTYDILNKEGSYLGGAISPGLTIRYEALNKLTAKLPLLKPEEIDFLIGNSTENSIHSGVINGLSNEIDGVIDQYQRQFKDLTIIFTGGDANFLAKRLKNAIFANSNFLLEGLNHILETNKS